VTFIQCHKKNDLAYIDLSFDDDIHINIFKVIAIIISNITVLVSASSVKKSAKFLVGGAQEREACRIQDNAELFLITFLFHANSIFPLATHGFHVPGSC